MVWLTVLFGAVSPGSGHPFLFSPFLITLAVVFGDGFGVVVLAVVYLICTTPSRSGGIDKLLCQSTGESGLKYWGRAQDSDQIIWVN